ncbi:MAG: enoyl-[acyl-carrier-protein] reductase FabK [Candidatus Nealsonbacteria bacterium CG08_land_8_20_14_0_20_38_20]|uniref:Enoyl-[acyl-carrier-protein] reductase FabK n=1 Tax=Candidatus Nealsonbacteria bacterium CG08_land_8_20_14_0_20_38_20 TaxID=1974705 RepID=A0A2H0YLJ8_9BACT|nr:MAG: enoyl-[acyl-carrier-protein] reductase FabK [Candidatus Nealsonbacteria bacterium CG08_land_8_20_14_0_20_38_20]
MAGENKLTKLLGIKYPIIQGGMAGISEANLVSAVSNAGGLGTLGSGLMPAQWLAKEIEKTKKLTNEPFAVNLFLQNPKIEELMKTVIRCQAPVVFTGGGNPLPLFPYFQAAGIKIITVVPSPRLAKKMEEQGADAVVVEGMEAGGHIGKNTTFCLIPQAKKILKQIPLIAAGGIYDGKTAAAAFLLGADGIQMGTRFLASKECLVSDAYKKRLIEATADDIEVVLRFTGHPLRVIKNEWAEEMKKLEEKGAFPEEIKADRIVSSLGSSNIDTLPLMAGISAAGISEIKTCREIIEEIIEYNTNLRMIC